MDNTSPETTPTRPIRVLLADDHTVMRRGVRTVIELLDGWSVCGEACNGLQAVELATRLRPELVVMDIDMPELDGIEATHRIKERCPEIEVLIFTGLESEQLIRDVFDSGARSYILKTDGKDQLEAALRSVAAHRAYFTTQIGESLFAKFLVEKQKRTDSAGRHLNPREKKILRLLSEGMTTKEVAAEIGTTAKVAEAQRADIMRRLQLQSLSDLIRYAVRNHIISA